MEKRTYGGSSDVKNISIEWKLNVDGTRNELPGKRNGEEKIVNSD